MLFSTNIFIFCFLPTCFCGYFLINGIFKENSTKNKLQNLFLLLMSMFFYFYGSGKYIVIMIASIIINYMFAIIIDKNKEKRKRKVLVFLCVLLNIAMLIYFKYTNFLLTAISPLLNNEINMYFQSFAQIALPIGISFYTFQAMSYTIDVYRDTIIVQKNILKLALYISFFPQLIAGPIVRYTEVENDISSRESDLSDAYNGICRFCMGLSKKVLLADTFGKVSADIIELPLSELSPAVAWVGAIMYTFQIYFDFSGYSDMAIGLAKIFGFNFNENFNLPYISQNITEFWKRWHISLSTWFKSYVYIPLGGNRRGTFTTYRNLFIIFVLCGLWHGANYTFLVWGIYYGVLLVIERILLHKFNFKMQGFVGRLVTMFLVVIGWILFMSPSLQYAIAYLGRMFNISHMSSFQYFTVWYYLQPNVVFLLVISCLISMCSLEKTRDRFNISPLRGIVSICLLMLSIVYMSKLSFSPFIYFKF